MKVMPNAYQDAAERLLDELRASKELNDANKVIDRISQIISRRSRSTGEAHAAKVEAMLGFTESCNNRQEEEGDALAFNRNPGKAKVDPKRNIFCRKCPHKGKDGTTYDCLGDPRKMFPAVPSCAWRFFAFFKPLHPNPCKPPSFLPTSNFAKR